MSKIYCGYLQRTFIKILNKNKEIKKAKQRIINQ